MEGLTFHRKGLTVVDQANELTREVIELSKKQNKDVLEQGEIQNSSNKLYASVSYFTVDAAILPDWNVLFCQLHKFLVPGGTLHIHVILSKSLDEWDTKEDIRRYSLLQGFTEGTFTGEGKSNILGQPVIHYACIQPQWKEGAVSRIGDDNELTDDIGSDPNNPLADYQPRTINRDDCSTKKKACADCTCGRKEAEDTASAGVDNAVAQPHTSKCGSCYLGDAFRCSSCPYKGLPAFKPGEKVMLEMDQPSSGLKISQESNNAMETGSTRVHL